MAYFKDKTKSKYPAYLHYCPHAKCFDESLVHSSMIIKTWNIPMKVFFSGLHSLECQCKHQVLFKTKTEKNKKIIWSINSKVLTFC